MTIVDATTSLALAWTEQAIVSFTAGSLSSITECMTYIETHLRRGTIGATTEPSTSEVQLAFIRGKQELMTIKSFSFARRFAQATAVGGTYRYALPPDFQGLKGIRDQTNDRDLLVWPPGIFDTRFPDPASYGTNEPQVVTIKGMEMWIYPPPSGAFVLELEYERSGDDNTATDVSWLPQAERFRCCDFAIADLLDSLQDERAQVYWQRWGQGLMRSGKSDSKKRWRHRRQAISIFQEAAARGFAHDPEGGHKA